jgi:ferritin-like metal-binding protein YciE
LIEEGQKIIRQHHKRITRDTAFILIAQKAAHCKIAAYDLLVKLADILGMDTITDQLKYRLEEEKETGELLSNIHGYKKDPNGA